VDHQALVALGQAGERLMLSTSTRSPPWIRVDWTAAIIASP
jgi:hypothetical protein